MRSHNLKLKPFLKGWKDLLVQVVSGEATLWWNLYYLAALPVYPIFWTLALVVVKIVELTRR